MHKFKSIDSVIFVKNIFINILGYVLPMIFLLFATPIIVRGMGTENYGVLSLSLLIIGYFAIFDFGLGASTTRFVAEAIGKKNFKRIPNLIWSTFSIQIITGTLAGSILAITTPILIEHIFEVPPHLRLEAKKLLWLTCLTFPFTFISGSLSGIFAAFGRFDWVNLVKIINSISIYLACLICVYLDSNISLVLEIILVLKGLTFLLEVFLVKKIVPNFFIFTINLRSYYGVLNYSLWLTLSNIINPLMFYLDRFFIGATLSLTALTYYSVSFDLASRIWFISTSLTMVLFPAFSKLIVEKNNKKTYKYFFNSLKFLLLFSGPIACLMIAFSGEILRTWIDDEFSNNTKLALQIFMLSTLFDYPGIISSTFLEGVGKSKLLALIKMFYIPIHCLLIYFGLKILGITGAAFAILVMRIFYSIVFTHQVIKILKIDFKSFFKELYPSYLVLFILMFLCAIIEYTSNLFNSYYLVFYILVIVLIYSFIIWYYVLNSLDKSFLHQIINMFLGIINLSKKKNGN